MYVDFLSGTSPIVKEYDLRGEHLNVKSYPHIYEFSSHRENIPTLDVFHHQLLKYARQGACVMKGRTTRTLVCESRRDSHDPDEHTEWICLDVDGVQNVSTIDDLLPQLGIQDIDYIVQWSSSMSLPGYQGLRCHVFMLLTKPVHPATLKDWLRNLNLDVPLLANQLSLTKTGNALHWPLDTTTCQNDKLLYIAPPILKGLTDPYPGKDRITLHHKKHRTFTLPVIPILSTVIAKTEKKINDLRKTADMKPRRFTHKYQGTVDYLANPDIARITGKKTERGFVYFNLNDGDSWGYFHPEDQPEFIHNFKGEPTYRTQDLLPSYWAAITRQNRPASRAKQGETYLAFRERRTAKLYNAVINAHSRNMELIPAVSEKQLDDFLILHGQPPLGKTTDIIEVVFNPANPVIYDDDLKQLNTHVPSTIVPAPGSWKLIERILLHVLGNDQAAFDHFINWLACAVQRQDNTGTAWIWHGTFGTGKGVLFTHVLTPIFGAANVVPKRMDELDETYSGFMWNKLLVFVDEMEQGQSLYHSKIEAKLKNLITEPMISIRVMYRDSFPAHNYTNMIFASNKPAPVMVRPGDRRFNVGAYQPKPLPPSIVNTNQLAVEVPAFMSYLLQYPYDREKARTPLINAARDELIETNMIAIDGAAKALLEGDVGFFWDLLPSKPHANPLLAQKYEHYKDVLLNVVKTKPQTMIRDEIYDLFEYAVGGMADGAYKLAAQLKHHKIHFVSIWNNGRSYRGIRVNWHISTKLAKRIAQDIKQGLP